MSGTPLTKSNFFDIDIAGQTMTPLWTLSDFNDEKKLIDWLKKTVECCEAYYRDFFQVQMDNLLLYKGIQWLNQDKYSNRFVDRQGVATRKSPRVVINHLFDFVEQWVSRLARYRPAVAIYPTNNEYQDEVDARISKYVLDHIWYQNTIDQYLQEFARQAKIFGEAYMWITWDPTRGDLHPDQIKQTALGQRTPVLGPNGNPVNSEQGDPLMIEKAVRVGDIKYQIDAPWHVFDMPCRNRDDIDWSIKWRATDIEYLKAKYPEKAKELKLDKSVEVFSNYRMDIGKLKNEVIEYELFHRQSEFLDKGRYIRFTSTCILENTDLPYSHGKIPYVKLTDIDVPDQIRGMSFFQQLFPIQNQINACASLIYKSLVLFAHPKIVMPDGACEVQQLENQSTVISYQGGVPPTLMVNNPVSGELFQYLDKLEQTAEKLSGIFTMSRGEAPSGVRAAKALRVLEEQEDKRAFNINIKYNQSGLVENAKQTLSIAGTFYNDSDGRLARVVGKDNEFQMVQFKSANLSKPYDIRIENTTALSQSPAAMIEDLNEIIQLQIPDNSIISKEQYVEYLGLGRSDTFQDQVTKAVRCAKSENQDMLSGVAVAEPRPDEDLIAHWREHMKVPQSRDYKEGKVPDQLRAAFENHMMITEYLMFKKAFGLTLSTGQPIEMGNPLFQQKLMLYPDWPIYFKIPVPGQAPMMPPGQGPTNIPPGIPQGSALVPPPVNQILPPAPVSSAGQSA